MSRFILAVVACLAVACGGPDWIGPDSIPVDPDNRQLSEFFAGGWSGVLTMTANEEVLLERSALVHVSVDGPKMTIDGMCDGQSFEAEGNGAATMWYGDITCLLPRATCAGGSVRLRSGIIRLATETSLYVSLHGEISGCGASGDVVGEFRATR